MPNGNVAPYLTFQRKLWWFCRKVNDFIKICFLAILYISLSEIELMVKTHTDSINITIVELYLG